MWWNIVLIKTVVLWSRFKEYLTQCCMISTCFLAGSSDILYLRGRITGQYSCTHVVVSFLLFWCRFLLTQPPHLDLALSGSCHFSASMGCKCKENRSQICCVSTMNSRPVCGFDEPPITSGEAVIKHTTGLFHWRACRCESRLVSLTVAF